MGFGVVLMCLCISKRLAPTWDQLSDKITNDKTVIAKVDCTVSKDVCQKAGVSCVFSKLLMFAFPYFPSATTDRPFITSANHETL